jgi:hypothetical protein
LIFQNPLKDNALMAQYFTVELAAMADKQPVLVQLVVRQGLTDIVRSGELRDAPMGMGERLQICAREGTLPTVMRLLAITEGRLSGRALVVVLGVIRIDRVCEETI